MKRLPETVSVAYCDPKPNVQIAVATYRNSVFAAYDEESLIRAKTVSSAYTRDAFTKKITLNEILGYSASSDVEPVRTSYAKRDIHGDYHEDLERVKGHKVSREQLSMRSLLKKFCWIAIGSAPSSKFDSPSISASRTNFLWRDFITPDRRAAA